MSRRIAIIPARGGSKRLPRKNILPVAGRPMLSYTISTALAAGLFEDVVVSTEDAEIASVAQETGATVHARPESLAQDASTMAQVCLDALEHYPSSEFCCIYATAVLLSAETIRDAYTYLDAAPSANYVMGVSSYNYPPVQALRVSDEGFLHYMWPEFIGMQSQSYPSLCVSNGTFIWARTGAFQKDGTFYGGRLRGFVVPEEQAIDVDVMEDYEAIQRRIAGLE